MSEVIVKLTSDHIKVKGGEYVCDVVTCGECKHCYVDGEQVKFNVCELNHNKVQSDDWFCADGERRDDE